MTRIRTRRWLATTLLALIHTDGRHGLRRLGCTNPRIRDVILGRAIADEADPDAAMSVDGYRAQWIASILMSNCRRGWRGAGSGHRLDYPIGR